MQRFRNDVNWFPKIFTGKAIVFFISIFWAEEYAQEEYSSLLKVTKEDVNIAFDVSIFSFTYNIT